jgi:hypothetical protein
MIDAGVLMAGENIAVPYDAPRTPERAAAVALLVKQYGLRQGATGHDETPMKNWFREQGRFRERCDRARRAMDRSRRRPEMDGR